MFAETKREDEGQATGSPAPGAGNARPEGSENRPNPAVRPPELPYRIKGNDPDSATRK